MTKEEMAKAYAEGFENKNYREIAYAAFLCGFTAKCESSLPSNLDEAVQPEWRKAPISFMGGAIIKTSIGPMYSDHVVAGQLYLKFEELHLLPGYDEN